LRIGRNGARGFLVLPLVFPRISPAIAGSIIIHLEYSCVRLFHAPFDLRSRLFAGLLKRFRERVKVAAYGRIIAFVVGTINFPVVPTYEPVSALGSVQFFFFSHDSISVSSTCPLHPIIKEELAMLAATFGETIGRVEGPVAFVQDRPGS